MQFQVGHYFKYTGTKLKHFHILKCVYADNHIAVMEPYHAGSLTPSATFSLPQECKYYVLDENFTSIDHRIAYYIRLRDHYKYEVAKSTVELESNKKAVQDYDELITKLKGELK